MKKKAMVMMCSALLTMQSISFAEGKCESNYYVSSYVYADEITRFNRNRDLFNSKTNEQIRAKRIVEKEAAQTKKISDEAQDKGEGQVKVRF